MTRLFVLLSIVSGTGCANQVATPSNEQFIDSPELRSDSLRATDECDNGTESDDATSPPDTAVYPAEPTPLAELAGDRPGPSEESIDEEGIEVVESYLALREAAMVHGRLCFGGQPLREGFSEDFLACGIGSYAEFDPMLIDALLCDQGPLAAFSACLAQCSADLQTSPCVSQYRTDQQQQCGASWTQLVENFADAVYECEAGAEAALQE